MISHTEKTANHTWMTSFLCSGLLLLALTWPLLSKAQNTTFSLLEPFPELIVSGGGSTADWGDFDGDGDLDLVVAGYAPDMFTTYITKIYRNDGAGVFTDLPISLAMDAHKSAFWGDYDSDGDLDLLLKAYFGFKIYRNDGYETFSQVFYKSCFPGTLAMWGEKIAKSGHPEFVEKLGCPCSSIHVLLIRDKYLWGEISKLGHLVKSWALRLDPCASLSRYFSPAGLMLQVFLFPHLFNHLTVKMAVR